MKVRLFAALKDLAGASEVDVEASTVGGLVEQLSQRFGPSFDRIMSAGTVVVDGEKAPPDREISPDAEVALLPPVSGGSAGESSHRGPRSCWLRGGLDQKEGCAVGHRHRSS